jgi:hypothetical protein
MFTDFGVIGNYDAEKHLCQTRGRPIRTTSSSKVVSEHDMGYYLKCGAHLPYCGKVFSTKIRYLKCEKVNIHKESQQPEEIVE